MTIAGSDSNARLSMLVVSPAPLSEPLIGTAIQIVHRSLHLAEHFDVTLLSPTDSALLPASLKHAVAMHIPIQRIRRNTRQVVPRLLMSGATYHESRFSFELGETAKLLASAYDIVYLNSLFSWSLWRQLSQYTRGATLVVDHHNDDGDRFRQFAAADSSKIKRFAVSHLADRYDRRLRELGNHADVMLFVSQEDRLSAELTLGVNRRARLMTMESGVDFDNFMPLREQPRERRLVFVGSLDVHMNQIAVREILTNYWPLLSERIPDLKLSIAGRNPPEWMMQYSSPSIEIAASPVDIRPYLWKSIGMLAPFDVGGGRKLKMLEAMSAGTIVLATTAAMQGIAAGPGTHFLPISTPQDALTATQHIIDSPSAANEMRRNALAFARQQDWRTKTNEIASSLIELAQASRPMPFVA